MDRFTTEILIRIHFCQISSRRGVGLGRYYHKSGGSGPTCWGNEPPGISCRLFMLHHLQQWTCARVAHHWYTLFEYDMQLKRIYKLWKHPVTYFLKEFKFSHSIHFLYLNYWFIIFIIFDILRITLGFFLKLWKLCVETNSLHVNKIANCCSRL